MTPRILIANVDSEDGGSRFLRNIRDILPDYVTS
jgi:hypothetical protein